MKNLKTGILTVIIAIGCLSNVIAQDNVKTEGKVKGKIIVPSDIGMHTKNKDGDFDSSSDTQKKGLNAVNVKLARGIDKKDIRIKAVDTISDTDSNSFQRKGWDGSVKGGKASSEFLSKKGYDHYQAKGELNTTESQRKGIEENGIRKNEGIEVSDEVTVPKQTQGATFGEKVNQGLHQAGGAIGQGASKKTR